MLNLPIAQIVGVFGLRGELKCRPTSAGEDAVDSGVACFLDAEGARSLTIAHARRHHGQLLISIDGVESVEAAQVLVGTTLYLPKEDLRLRDGEYLDEDLVGLRVIDPQGVELGIVGGIEHFPAQDCLVVGPARALVPLVRAFVRNIDLVAGSITMDLPKGLLDSGDAEEA
ncbi:MAG TPA: ribosome maturation factor RimM [Candidatus Baltobacteraceae bacterium]